MVNRRKKYTSSNVLLQGFLYVLLLFLTSCTAVVQDLENGILANNPSLVKKALKKGLDPNKPLDTGMTPLQWAVRLDSDKAALELLKAGAKPDLAPIGQPPIVYAAKGQRCVKMLIDHGADVNATWSIGQPTALYVAAGLKNSETVKLLLDAGAKTNVPVGMELSPLDVASRAGDLECVKLLYPKTQNIDWDRLLGVAKESCKKWLQEKK